MAEHTAATVTGADESQQAFTQRWDSLSDDERQQRAVELFNVTRGSDRKITELHQRIQELETSKESATETTEKAVSNLSDLQGEIAEIRAQKLLVAKQSQMLQRAADHDIDAALAISFAETGDADRTFDLAIAEIERRTQSEVNSRLAQAPVPKSSPSGSQGYDLTRMSQSERDRLPASVRERAFNTYLEETV